MTALGEDFSGGRRRLFVADNPAGLWFAVAAAVFLMVTNIILQFGFALVMIAAFLDAQFNDPGAAIKGFMIGIFPSSAATAGLAWVLAGKRGGDPWRVLNLHLPKLGWLGWALVTGGFLAAMYVFITALVLVLGIDPAQYQPVEGQDSSETVGLVKQAMFDIAHDPWLFALVLPSVVIGAPIAEELVFRGQVFAALSQTRLGMSGTTVLTSAAWSLMHLSEPWFSVGIIFVLGLVFGYLLWRFGSLWVTIACHAAWNAVYASVMFSSAGS
jgi:membrane protease YdiL (CAAX protease family)